MTKEEVEQSEHEEEMPQPRKKTYRRPIKGTLPSGKPDPEIERRRLIIKIVVVSLFIAVIVTLTVLATGDRPLAKAITSAMNSSGEMYSNWFEMPSNDTDAMGDDISEYVTTTPFTTESWTLAITTTPTGKPKAEQVTPSAVMNYGNFTYEFFKHPWMLDVAINICRRRKGQLIYIDDKAEMEQTRDWIRFNVTDKLPYWKAGYYWTSGMSINSNPLEGNYNWIWRGGMVKTGYQNFCPNYTSDIIQSYWDANRELRNLNIVMDFKRIHYLEPTMGCWKVMFPLNEELKVEEHKEAAGNPFICKLRS